MVVTEAAIGVSLHGLSLCECSGDSSVDFCKGSNTVLESMFMLVAAYLIFGSWLNYNRYDARGYVQLP